jgi:hypothetical protein
MKDLKTVDEYSLVRVVFWLTELVQTFLDLGFEEVSFTVLFLKL